VFKVKERKEGSGKSLMIAWTDVNNLKEYGTIKKRM
jgi:hypothetical protein